MKNNIKLLNEELNKSKHLMGLMESNGSEKQLGKKIEKEHDPTRWIEMSGGISKRHILHNSQASLKRVWSAVQIGKEESSKPDACPEHLPHQPTRIHVRKTQSL